MAENNKLAEQLHKDTLDSWQNITEDLKIILGRPNFRCGNIARVLRAKGYTCKPKAEEEQALVIHTMTIFYNKYGDSWADEYNKYLNSKPVIT